MYSRTIGSLIKDDYLPPVIGRNILTRFSLKGVKSDHDDFIAKPLPIAVNIKQRNQFIVDKCKQHAHQHKSNNILC